MRGHPIFIRIDRDRMHREFVGRAEDADGNFLETSKIGMRIKCRVHGPPYPAVGDKDLCQRSSVTC